MTRSVHDHHQFAALHANRPDVEARQAAEFGANLVPTAAPRPLPDDAVVLCEFPRPIDVTDLGPPMKVLSFTPGRHPVPARFVPSLRPLGVLPVKEETDDAA